MALTGPIQSLAALRDVVSAQRNYFVAGQTRSLRGRLEALTRLERSLLAYREALLSTLSVELGRSEEESDRYELQPLFEALNRCRLHLRRWLRPRQRIEWRRGALIRHSEQRLPLGIVAVYGNQTWPLLYSLLPTIDALAAGNCVIIKLAQKQGNFAKTFQRMISEAFPANYVSLIYGEDILSEALARSELDHIVYTGSAVQAQRLLQAASHRLTPVTLQLGGKLPVIVTADADLDMAVQRILQAKRINVGQDCLAPDYCLVEETVYQRFVDRLSWHLRYSSEVDPVHNPKYQAIYGQRQYERLKKLLNNGRIVWGGRSNDETRQIELTILDRLDFTSPIMRQEIYGPILPLIKYDCLPSLLSRLNKQRTPLVATLFSGNLEDWTLVSKHLRAGQLTFNCLPTELPLSQVRGGPSHVGGSQYLGYEGFCRFSYLSTATRTYSLRRKKVISPQADAWYGHDGAIDRSKMGDNP